MTIVTNREETSSKMGSQNSNNEKPKQTVRSTPAKQAPADISNQIENDNLWTQKRIFY